MNELDGLINVKECGRVSKFIHKCFSYHVKKV